MRETKRKECKECPWKVKSKHNNNFLNTIYSWVKKGKRENTEHRCHMISNNIWASTDTSNICIGSTQNIKNEN